MTSEFRLMGQELIGLKSVRITRGTVTIGTAEQEPGRNHPAVGAERQIAGGPASHCNNCGRNPG